MTDEEKAAAMRAKYKQGYDQAIFASTWGQAYRIGFTTAILAMTEQMTEQMQQEQAKG